MASHEQAPAEAPVLPLSKYSKRVVLKTILGRCDGGLGLMGQRVVIGGWVKSSREFRMAPEVVEPKDSSLEAFQTNRTDFQSILKVFVGKLHWARDKLDANPPRPPEGSISILQVSDGSCVSSLQVIVESYLAPPSEVMPTGTCILAEGKLQKPPLQRKQTIELKAEKILHIGLVEMDSYPFSRKSLPLELFRDSAHFRPPTTMVASVMSIRSALTRAIHTFSQENGFLHVQVPIITTTDCEGSGKNFQVTTLLGEEKLEDQTVFNETIKASIKEKSKKVEELKRSPSNKEALAAAIQDLKKTSDLLSHLEAKQKAKSRKSIKVNFCEDFFSRRTYLTASGRLHLESFTAALGNVYSFGPRFHANKSNSKKLLAEMWILELEMAFSQLEDSMECASEFLKFICKWILENCEEDLKFVARHIDELVVDRLQLIATDSFEKISYTEAVEVLKQVTERKFENEAQWGSPLSEEHESYLTDEIYNKPLIIYNQPKELAPFSVRLNDDGKTAASFDVIVPKVGTLIRGSQNEERLNILSTRIEELGLEKQQYEWYLDLHRDEAVKSCGFSFVFDPLILYATGLNDAREVVPFPRSFGQANN